jgi:hypothetical protein
MSRRRQHATLGGPLRRCALAWTVRAVSIVDRGGGVRCGRRAGAVSPTRAQTRASSSLGSAGGSAATAVPDMASWRNDAELVVMAVSPRRWVACTSVSVNPKSGPLIRTPTAPLRCRVRMLAAGGGVGATGSQPPVPGGLLASVAVRRASRSWEVAVRMLAMAGFGEGPRMRTSGLSGV